MKYCLVVDDSKVVRKVVRKILEQFSFEVGEAENGQIALRLCAARMPDVIFLDWHMPEMDGLACLKQLRAMEKGEQPVIIFCTTETNIRNIQQAMEAGASEYIMKPFDQEIIHHKLIQMQLL